MNGLPVNTTACGDLTKSLCNGDPKLLNVVQRMAGASTLWAVAVHREIKVQLVPKTRHQTLLGALKDDFTHNEVFGPRSDIRSTGPYHEVLKSSKKGQHQLIILRVMTLTNTQPRTKGNPALAFLVKVFNREKDRSHKAALKLGVVFGESLQGGHGTVAEYPHNDSVALDPDQDPRIVMPKHVESPDVASPVVRGPPLDKARRFRSASWSDSDPLPGASGGTRTPAAKPLSTHSAEPDVEIAGAGGRIFLEWKDTPGQMDAGTQPKKPKHADVANMIPRYGHTTCESLVPQTFTISCKHMTPTEFAVVVVMDGHSAVPLPSVQGHALRMDRAAVWSALYNFWSSTAMQSVAGVLALALDGYGHGKMQLLQKQQYSGCCGRWDMMAVWAAKYLELFPTKFVSDTHTCPTFSIMFAMIQFMSLYKGFMSANIDFMSPMREIMSEKMQFVSHLCKIMSVNMNFMSLFCTFMSASHDPKACDAWGNMC